jgi:hypothetical protein
MSNKVINTIPIDQFMEKVKAADMQQQKEIRLDIKTAKSLAYAISELSLRLNQNYDEILDRIQSSKENEVISVVINGGGFEN